jgi:hypothetical protein
MKEGVGPGGMTCIGFSSTTGALGSVAAVQPRNSEEHGASALDPEAGDKEGRANASPAHCAEGERARRLGARVEDHHHAVAKHHVVAQQSQ